MTTYSNTTQRRSILFPLSPFVICATCTAAYMRHATNQDRSGVMASLDDHDLQPDMLSHSRSELTALARPPTLGCAASGSGIMPEARSAHQVRACERWISQASWTAAGGSDEEGGRAWMKNAYRLKKRAPIEPG